MPIHRRERAHPAWLSLAVAVVLSLGLASSSSPASAPMAAPGPRAIALVGGRVIDGYGGRPISRGVVVIEGERITAVGRMGEVAIPAGAEVVSTAGMSVLPGLWDWLRCG